MVLNPRVLAVVLTTAVVSCAEQGPEGPGRFEVWVVGPEPIVSIGGQDDREGYLTQRVVGMTRLSTGQIVIADGGSQQVRFYDSAGVHLRTVGGFGGGPGEFSQLLGLTRGDADTIYAHSLRPGLTIFTPEGEFVDQFRVNRSSISPRCYYGEETVVASGPSIIATSQLNGSERGCPEMTEGLRRDSVLVVRHDPVAKTSVVLARIPGVERVGPDWRPYGAMPVNSWDWASGVVGGTDESEVIVMTASGEELGQVAVPWEARRIPRDAMQETAPEQRRGDGSVEIGEPWDYPAQYPRVARVVYDRAGWIWFMEYPHLNVPATSWRVRQPVHGGRFGVEQGSRWRAVSSEGGAGPIAVSLPAGFHLWEVGPGYVLGLHRDGLDLESVQLFETHAS